MNAEKFYRNPKPTLRTSLLEIEAKHAVLRTVLTIAATGGGVLNDYMLGRDYIQAFAVAHGTSVHLEEESRYLKQWRHVWIDMLKAAAHVERGELCAVVAGEAPFCPTWKSLCKNTLSQFESTSETRRTEAARASVIFLHIEAVTSGVDDAPSLACVSNTLTRIQSQAERHNRSPESWRLTNTTSATSHIISVHAIKEAKRRILRVRERRAALGI